MLSELDELWKNGQWVNEMRQTYTYDVIGNMLSISRHEWDGYVWMPSTINPHDLGSEDDGGLHLIDKAGNEYHYYDAWFLRFTYEVVVTEVVAESGDVPVEYALTQNYPNPFNPSTTIEFALPHAGYVTLKAYNVLGEEVAALIEGDHAAGTFKATWNASGMPSGVYLYRLTAGDYVQTRKMMLIR